jgi:hypothetical protein
VRSNLTFFTCFIVAFSQLIVAIGVNEAATWFQTLAVWAVCVMAVNMRLEIMRLEDSHA